MHLMNHNLDTRRILIQKLTELQGLFSFDSVSYEVYLNRNEDSREHNIISLSSSVLGSAFSTF